MFKSIDELVSQATQAGAPISRVMIDSEMEQSGKTERQLREGMAASLEVMKAAARKGLQGVASHSGMTGGDARRLMAYLEKGKALTGDTFVRA
ncbi:MAG TPA: L-serine ammonia-lyase, iron-sulfur-dependent, subunit alpha, partial [Clostridia bacterium]|nr:L-serine ammonia-lyase, iron-sulfur-dependent, subunit alpha [Clostridia bacterium]